MKTKRLIVLASCLAAVTGYAQITPGFEPGNLIVLRVGNSTTTLASSGDPVYLDEYTTNGVLTNSVTIPDSGPTSLIIGSATSEGAITRSANSNYIVMVGYNTDYPYTSSLANSTSTAVPRGIATIDFNGNYDFITNTTTAFSGNNIRCGASDGSSNFWAVGATTGVVYMGLAAPPSIVESALMNSETINIINGSLHLSTQKGSPPGIYSISGLPVTTGVTNLVFSTGSSSSLYAFAISPDNTIAYVADDRALSSGGGILKYVNNSGTWSLAYTLGTGNGSTVGARGMTVKFGSTPIIYATTAETTLNRLISITDSGSASTAILLATAGANEIFRGVQFTPEGSAPAISQELQNETVPQGQSAEFSVVAVGSGTLYYLWQSNSVALTGWETNTTYTFNTTNDKPGSFPVEVLISNSWGVATSSATLTITSSNTLPPAPIIISEPESLDLNFDDTATFTVVANGTDLAYQWKFNSANLTDGPLVSGSTTPTLTLSNVFGGNDGTYIVTITNAGGITNSLPVTLEVADPELTSQPTGQTYLAGATIDLSASAVGTALRYQWTLNGANISGATDSAFVSTNAVASETGSYAVIVTGTYGAVTSTPVTVIIAPPQATFFPTNLVVLRAGDGVQTLSSSGNALFLDQYASNGVYVNTMALPDTGASALLISGVASSEGFMTRSADGRFLAVAGYNTNLGALTKSLSSTASTNVPRAVATIDGAGNYNLAASTTNAFSAQNIRAGATDGSNNFWGAGASDGTWYFGNTASAGPVQTTIANSRVINIENGNLVFSTQSGTNALYSLSGLPLTSGTPSLVFATANSSSPEDFAFNAAGTLAYVADDSTSGGIQRWQLNSGTWTNVYTLATGAARSLSVDFSGANPVIYAITAEAASNRFVTMTDTGALSVAVTLATSPLNEWFRAVRFSPASTSFPSPTLSAPTLTGSQIKFNLTGVAGSEYVIESSTNLITWIPFETNTAPFTVTLTNSPASPGEYFRAVHY